MIYIPAYGQFWFKKNLYLLENKYILQLPGALFSVHIYEHIIMCVCISCSVMSGSLRPHRLSHWAPLFMEFSRQEYWRELPLPSPEGLPNPGIESGLPHRRQIQIFQKSIIFIYLGKMYNQIKFINHASHVFVALWIFNVC